MKLVSIDLETFPIGRGADAAPRPVVVSVCSATDHYLVKPWNEDWSWLYEPDVYLLGANIAYDMSVLIRWCPELRARILELYAQHRILDVLLAERLVRNSFGDNIAPRGLDDLAQMLGMVLDKDSWRVLYGTLDTVPIPYWPRGAIDYALTDTWVPLRVFEALQEADTLGALTCLGHLTASAWGLHEAEIEGLYTHPARARALVSGAEARIRKVEARLKRSGLVRPDGSKNQKLAEAHMTERHPKGPRTPGGKPQLSDAATEQAHALAKSWSLAANGSGRAARGSRGSYLLPLLTEYTQADKMRTAARTLLLGHELPLQTRFDPLKETYRTSSKKPGGALVGVQLQNPWKSGGYREVFTPDPSR